MTTPGSCKTLITSYKIYSIGTSLKDHTNSEIILKSISLQQHERDRRYRNNGTMLNSHEEGGQMGHL